MTDWLEEVKAGGVAAVARAFGLAEGRRSSGHPTFACPACSKETRRGAPQTHDPAEKRGAIGLLAGGAGWKCFQCDAKGDAVTLAAWCGLGKGSRDLDRDDWKRLAEECETRRLCQAPETSECSASRKARDVAPGRPIGGGGGRVVSPSVESPPERPPAAEMLDLWQRCRPVTTDPEVTDWLRSRTLDPGAVADFDLARALPLDVTVPAWATCGRPWNAGGWRVVLPLYSAAGSFESVRARRVVTGDPKEVAPWREGGGGEVRGLVMADTFGRLLLSGDAKAAEVVRRCGVVVAEGSTDFLAWATRSTIAGATFGLFAGSWGAEIAARIPSGARVTIATDDDEQGEKYAAGIVATLAGRGVELRRWKPTKGGA